MKKIKITLFLAGFLIAQAFPIIALAEEVTSDINRYRGYEQSNQYYEQYEVRPDRSRGYLRAPEYRRGLTLGPGAAQVRNRTRLADSHMGIKFYEYLSCVSCHPGQAVNNMHVFRENLQCRQCHGGEPIASIQHYYSPMNPIRRHAYVCSKCHQGASASFASYLVHEPEPFAWATQRSFPALFYVFWVMAALAVGTFFVFLPHTFLWGIRELFIKKETAGGAKTTEQD